MLIIRAEQMNAIQAAYWRAFVDRACNYARTQWPGAPELESRVEQALATARRCGMESEFDLLRFMSISFALGGDFHANARYPWASEVLASPVYGAHTKMDLLWQLMLAEFGATGHEEPAEVEDEEHAAIKDEGMDHDVVAIEDEEAPPEPWSEDAGESDPEIEVDTDADEGVVS